MVVQHPAKVFTPLHGTMTREVAKRGFSNAPVAWLHDQPNGKIVTEYFPLIYSRYPRRREGVPFMPSVTGCESERSG